MVAYFVSSAPFTVATGTWISPIAGCGAQVVSGRPPSIPATAGCSPNRPLEREGAEGNVSVLEVEVPTPTPTPPPPLNSVGGEDEDGSVGAGAGAGVEAGVAEGKNIEKGVFSMAPETPPVLPATYPANGLSTPNDVVVLGVGAGAGGATNVEEE